MTSNFHCCLCNEPFDEDKRQPVVGVCDNPICRVCCEEISKNETRINMKDDETPVITKQPTESLAKTMLKLPAKAFNRLKCKVNGGCCCKKSEKVQEKSLDEPGTSLICCFNSSPSESYTYTPNKCQRTCYFIYLAIGSPILLLVFLFYFIQALFLMVFCCRDWDTTGAYELLGGDSGCCGCFFDEDY